MQNSCFSVKRLDGKCYLQYTFNKGEEDAVGLRVLTRALMPGLLPGLVWDDGDYIQLRFDIDGMIPLSDIPSPMPRETFECVLTGITDAAASAASHLFCADWICFEPDLVFFDPARNECRAASLPLKEAVRGRLWRDAAADVCTVYAASRQGSEKERALSLAEKAKDVSVTPGEFKRALASERFDNMESADDGESSGLAFSLKKLFRRDKNIIRPAAGLADRPVLKSEEGGLYRIDGFPFILGRGRECGFRASGNLHVSRRHAEIVRDGADYIFRDLGSKNGSRVNGKPVESAGTLLRHGDLIELPGVTLIFIPDRSAINRKREVTRLERKTE